VAAGAADRQAAEGDSVSIVRGILSGLAYGATVSLCLLGLVDAATGALTHSVMSKQARACALESYGTDVDIARCYTDRGLTPPENFNARDDR
jgi:uncharacterized membrane protein